MIFTQNSNNQNRSWKNLDEAYLGWLRSLWIKYEPYAPPSFQNDIENDEGKLDSLTWEMLLANLLLDAGFELRKASSTNQPDVCVVHNDQKIWIECCIPTRGIQNKPYSFEERCFTELDFCKPSKMQDIDINANTLRATSIISDKKRQHDTWITKGICEPNEPYIIAMHGKKLDFRMHNDDLPDIMRALYGMGNQEFIVDKETDRIVGSHYTEQLVVPKKTDNGQTKEIPSACFVNENYRNISGVLFSRDWYRFGTPDPTSCYVQNLDAFHPANISFASFAQEYNYDIEKREISMQKNSA